MSLSWDLGLKFLVVQQFDSDFGLEAGVGTYLFLPMFLIDGSIPTVQKILLTYRFTSEESPFHLSIATGIPVSSFMLYRDKAGNYQIGFMLAAGGSVTAGWRFDSGALLKICAGCGYPFIYDAGIWKAEPVKMPLGLWPALDFEFTWPLHSRTGDSEQSMVPADIR